MKMWTVYIRNQTACYVESGPDLHYPQELLVSSLVRKELNVLYVEGPFCMSFHIKSSFRLYGFDKSIII